MERTATDRLRANEKPRVASGVIANLGTALFASAIGRLFLIGLDGWAVVWIIFRCDGYSYGDTVDVVSYGGGRRWMKS